jgi:DNA-binding winged helix-turn-helix (wHTH) protein
MGDSICPCCFQRIPNTQLLVDLNTNTITFNGQTVPVANRSAEIVFALNEKYPAIMSHRALKKVLYGHVRENMSLSSNMVRARNVLAPFGIGIVTVRRLGFKLDFSEVGIRVAPHTYQELVAPN